MRRKTVLYHDGLRNHPTNGVFFFFLLYVPTSKTRTTASRSCTLLLCTVLHMLLYKIRIIWRNDVLLCHSVSFRVMLSFMVPVSPQPGRI
jgi:hypothetical protein